MNIGNFIVGYYFYVLIFGILAAFVFRAPIVNHKKLRRMTLILNLGNITLYIIVAMISKQEKISAKDIFKTIWNGSMEKNNKESEKIWKEQKR